MEVLNKSHFSLQMKIALFPLQRIVSFIYYAFSYEFHCSSKGITIILGTEKHES